MYYIKKIFLTGSGVETSGVDLTPGLNIIYGPSETGKSYITKCIKFMYGKKNSEIDDTFGFDTIHMILDVDGKPLTLVRRLDEEKITVSGNVNGIDNGDYSLSSGKKRNGDLWLTLMGIDEPTQIIKKNDFTPERLNFSSLWHMFLVDEDTISKTESILMPSQYPKWPKTKAAILYLMLGDNFLKDQDQKEKNKAKERRKAVEAFINTRISTLVTKKQTLKDSYKGLTMDELQRKIGDVLKEIDSAERQMNAAIVRSRELATEIVDIDEQLAESRALDECSYQPNQLMYWPSTPANGTFVYKETDGGWLDPDDILNAHPEWTDPTQLPTSSRESKANTFAQQKVQDPLEKEGEVGLFNRAFYPITKALDAFLSDVYEPTDKPDRYHLIESSSVAGVEIKEDKFVYSHHAKDAAYLKLCNAFDIIRIHKFGELDDKASFKAMCDFAMQVDEVKLLAANERFAQAEVDFTTVGDDEWKTKLKYQPRSQLLENSVYNLNLIFNNDPDFRNFAFNEMANRIQVTGPLPWERPEGNSFWRDADTAQLKSIIDVRYLPFSSRNHDVAFTKIADDRHFHPIRDYLNALPAWDGVKRVETLFIKYLQADDTEYVRTVTRKTFAAAVARIYVPGIKFDSVPVLDGDQGIGKSTIVKDLVTADYYSETLSLTDMDDKSGAEKLQGFWVIEIGELAGMKKADIEKVKAFLSTSDDKYRPSYGKVVESHPRQCIIIATVNGERGYLRDITGNRRFWIIKVHQKKQKKTWNFDEHFRQQFWAEAKEIWKSGEKLYLEGDVLAAAEEAQKDAMESDDRSGLIEVYLNTKLPDDWADMPGHVRIASLPYLKKTSAPF